MRHAYDNVELYRRKFDEAGIKPEDRRSLEDLSRFPFTTKADLRETYPFGMFAVPMADVRRIHASSGTTGRPTVVGYTENDLSMWADMIARSIRAAGGRRGHKVHISYGYGLFTGGLGAHYGAERAGCTVTASGGMTARQVQMIQDFEPEIIMVTPSYMLTLLDEFERQGVDPRTTSLQVGIFGAEPWTEAMRREIEERMDIHAVDIYGLSERMGRGAAQECVETKDGGTCGRTTSTPRWSIRSPAPCCPRARRARWSSPPSPRRPCRSSVTGPATCPGCCPAPPGPPSAASRDHRPLRRHDHPAGVNVFPSQIEEIVLRTPAVAPHFQVQLTRRGRMDHMTVRVEARPGAGAEQREAAAKTIAQGVSRTAWVSPSSWRSSTPETLERSLAASPAG